ncbi:MAG: hypothetical protein ACPGXK_03165 [Phycisphaerae bacterium]
MMIRCLTIATMIVTPLAAHAREQHPKTIAKAIQIAQAELAAGKHPGKGAVVFAVNTRQARNQSPNNQNALRYRLSTIGGGGYFPGQMMPGEIVTRYFRNDFQFELTAWGQGYHQLAERGVIRQGRVVVFDKLFLNPVTPGTACTLEGKVELEGRNSPGPVSVWIRGFPKFMTRPDGTFTVNDLGSGHYQVHSTESGFYGGWAHVTLTQGKTSFAAITMEKERYAVVRWAFQPNGTRDLEFGLETGVASVSAVSDRSFSLSEGFKSTRQRPDIAVRQDDGVLSFWSSHQGKEGPGLIKLDGVSFDDVKIAPHAAYTRDWQPMVAGSNYIVKTYDGKRFGKIEVLLVTTEKSEADRMLVSGTFSATRGKTPPPPAFQNRNAQTPKISLAVLDFDIRGEIEDGAAMAVTDLCRDALQQTDRFILVDRMSMREILGEEDLMAILKCDDTRCLVNYGRKLRAQKLITGRLSKAGSSIVMSMKMLDVSTAAIDAHVTERCRHGIDEILDRMDAVTERMIQDAIRRRRPGF